MDDNLLRLADQFLTNQLDEDQAQSILLRQLDAAGDAAQADMKIAQNDTMLRELDTKAPEVRAGNQELVNMYTELAPIAIPSSDRIIAGRVPIKEGAKILSVGKNTQLYTSPDNPNEIIVTFGKAPDAQAINQRLLDKANPAIAATTFDIRKEITKLQSLKGEELQNYAENILLNGAQEVARRKGLLEQQAKTQSGLADAESSLKKVMANGYNAITSAGREKIQAAQQRYNAALQAHAKLSSTLEASDPYIQELQLGLKLVERTELRQAQNDINRQAKKEDKAAQEEARLSAIPDSALQNYRYMTGEIALEPGKVLEQKKQILLKAQKDESFRRLMEATPENITALLTDRNLKVRQDALKILTGYDKLRFKNLRDSDATSTPTLDELKLKDIVDDPYVLAKSSLVDPKLRKELTTFKQMPIGGSKDIEEKRQTLLTTALQQYVQGVNLQKPSDATSWRTSDTIEGSPLKAVINQISATRKQGDAPFDLVVETFMATPAKNVDGSDMNAVQKKLILESAIRQIVSQYDEQWLQPNMSGLRSVWVEKIRNLANRAAVKQNMTNSQLLGDPDFMRGMRPGGF